MPESQLLLFLNHSKLLKKNNKKTYAHKVGFSKIQTCLVLLHEVSKPESISIFWLSFSSSLASLSLSLLSIVNFTPSTEYKSEFVKFSVAGQRHPVRKVVDLSRFAQMLVSVHQCELVAQADFTLREKIRDILRNWLNFSKERNKEQIF